ncbi:MAG: hypothetical protein H0Z18_05800 [Thermococcus sp.]|uniref:hypothetical protein n=1 Tax=Thermococcus sp. TaxID=35749 RepID=UPI001DAAE66F|nr:hypothetical protein [Thermococcus sp.]MBO8174753.1 hypothetical protein [Thermococcus sp.]
MRGIKKVILLIIVMLMTPIVSAETYLDILTNIHPSSTSGTIVWSHYLPANCSKLDKLVLTIEAYDVDYDNNIPVYLNDVFIGYLEGGHNNEWANTTFIITDETTLEQIFNASNFAIVVKVQGKSGDWVGVDESILYIEYTAGTPEGERYEDTQENIQENSTPSPIVWTHKLPENYTKILRFALIIQAYDVDYDNHVEVYVNDVFIGYLNGNANNQWTTTILTVSDENLINQIINNTNVLVVKVTPHSDDWVAINSSRLLVDYIAGENDVRSYEDTQEDVSDETTWQEITWTHTLPSNYSEIIRMTFIIEAYDVDKKNYIPVYANDVFIGYLEGGYNNKWSTTVISIRDRGTISQILEKDPHTITMRVVPDRSDWVKIGDAKLIVDYRTLTSEEESRTSAPIPLPVYLMLLAVILYYIHQRKE